LIIVFFYEFALASLISNKINKYSAIHKVTTIKLGYLKAEETEVTFVTINVSSQIRNEEVMKKMSNAIKIGFVRRSEVASEPNAYHVSPKNHHIHTQQETQHDGLHGQVNTDLKTNIIHEKQEI
jgi:transcription initiation factor IIE alpha subunit